MRKFLLSFLLCMTAVVSSFAESWTDGDGVTWNFTISNNGTTTGANLTGATGNPVTIPSNVYVGGTAYPIISIVGYAFYQCTSLQNIGDLSSCTSIGNYAFNDCTSLQNIGDLSSCTSIGNYAFRDCTSLQSVGDLPSCTSIGNDAFRDCSTLKSIGDLSSCTSIGINAFEFCPSLQNVDLSSCTSIGNYAFNHCTSLQSVGDLPSCTSIGNDAFRNCSTLKSIGDLSSCTSIGSQAFLSCTSLNKITINSNNVPIFGDDVFYGCTILNLFVPTEAMAKYKEALSGVDAYRFISIDAQTDWDIKTTAVENEESGVQNAIGKENLMNVISLKVTGDINAYDIFMMRNKMPNLHHLDLSDANIIRTEDRFPYYSSYTTENNIFPAYAFYEQRKLVTVKLPKTITSIGNNAFNSCSLNGTLEIPEGVTEIDNYAFRHCYGLKDILFPVSLTRIGMIAFEECLGLTQLVLPSSLTRVDGHAFSACSSITELVLPPALTQIGDGAFNCGNLKSVKVTAIDPKSVPISDATFSNYTTATLYLPYDEETGWDATEKAYYINTQWGQFLFMDRWRPTYDRIVLDGDYNQDQGTIPSGDEGIDADFGTETGYKVGEDASQDLDETHIKQDDNSGGSIIADGELNINTLVSEINVVKNRWYFFCFPFDVKIADIVAPGQSAWRYYNAEKRSNGFSAWTNVPNDAEYLTAGQGYIFRTNKDGVLSITITRPDFTPEDKSTELEEHASGNVQDASWNFVGNPYLSYYNIDNLVEFDAPITVWNGSGYEAVRPGDDDYVLQPYQAFFVQKPVGKNSVDFDKDARETYTEVQNHAAGVKAEGGRKINPNRLLVNLTIGRDEKQMDKTRVVFNNDKSMGYEMECDAAKFISTDNEIQFYTIDQKNTCYAINERPVENGEVKLVVVANAAGSYTIGTKRMDTPMLLVDVQKGITHDLEVGSYTFETEAGTFADRFMLKMKNNATGIENIEGKSSEPATYYNMAGQQTSKATKGVNVVKQGEKARKVLK